MKPPIKNLIGGVEELHTREYLFKISAQTMGCRESQTSRMKNSKNASPGAELVFLGRKRERGRRRSTWLDQGVAAPPGRLGQGWPPWSAPGAYGSLFTWKILFYFFWNFSNNFSVEKISKFQKLHKLPWKLKRKLNMWSFKNINFGTTRRTKAKVNENITSSNFYLYKTY